MAWWAWLLIAGSALLLLTGALLLLLPLRIFVRYLREDNRDHLSLRLKLGFIVLERDQRPAGPAGSGVRWRLLAGRFSAAAATLQKMEARWARMSLLGRRVQERFLKRFRRADLAGDRTRRGEIRWALKKITWSRFNLEIAWGSGDPALTAIAAGGCWSLLGLLAGELQRRFTVTVKPRLKVKPLFRRSALRVLWEGEAALSLYRWLKLWQLFNKTGGADSGTSPH